MEETKSITLPVSQKVVVMRGYMTGYMDQEIRAITLAGNKSRVEKQVDPSGDESQLDQGPVTMVMETDPTVQIEADKKRIELMVLSVDGNKENTVDTVLNLPAEDVNFILKQIKGNEDSSKVVAGDLKAPSN